LCREREKEFCKLKKELALTNKGYDPATVHNSTEYRVTFEKARDNAYVHLSVLVVLPLLASLCFLSLCFIVSSLERYVAKKDDLKRIEEAVASAEKQLLNAHTGYQKYIDNVLGKEGRVAGLRNALKVCVLCFLSVFCFLFSVCCFLIQLCFTSTDDQRTRAVQSQREQGGGGVLGTERRAAGAVCEAGGS
jgi:hypothetical protein